LSVLVGHSGAEATWGNRLIANQAEELQPTTVADQGSTADSGISVAEVLTHNSVSDCWSVIDGNVYDLTSYVSTHKGGAGVIEAICGKDGTKAFSGEHAGAPKPATDLSSLLLGPLGVASASGETSMPTDSVYTAAEIQKHNTSTDCWSVINGEVYDLTSYVKDHPGGASLIAAICGKDGSAAFSGEHAGEKQPKNILAAFAVGTFATGTTLPEAVVQYDEDEDEDEDEEEDDD
jgi:cytochrome b involved in lipid metabolism